MVNVNLVSWTPDNHNTSIKDVTVSYCVGPNNVVQKVEAKDVVKSELFAWKNEDGDDPIYAYTFVEAPKVGDVAIMPDASTLVIDSDEITAIGEDTITAFSTDFERDSEHDIGE